MAETFNSSFLISALFQSDVRLAHFCQFAYSSE